MFKFKKILLILVFFISWLLLTGLYLLQSDNITGIVDTKLSLKIVNKPQGEFLEGQIIKIEFTSNENYLGQFSLRFYNYDRINSDEVIFRIKEKGSTDWYYENVYKTNQFQPNKLFPFGFPILIDSKNKKYIVEVESIKGKEEDAITLSSYTPESSLMYQYPKKEIFKNVDLFIEFIKNKIKYIELNIDTIVSVGIYINFIFLSLLLVYIVIQNSVFNIKNLIQNYVVYIIVSGLLFLLINVVLLYIGLENMSELFAILGYLFIVSGIITLLIKELVTKYKNKSHEKKRSKSK